MYHITIVYWKSMFDFPVFLFVFPYSDTDNSFMLTPLLSKLLRSESFSFEEFNIENNNIFLASLVPLSGQHCRNPYLNWFCWKILTSLTLSWYTMLTSYSMLNLKEKISLVKGRDWWFIPMTLCLVNITRNFPENLNLYVYIYIYNQEKKGSLTIEYWIVK